MTDKPKTLRDRAAEMKYTWDSDEGDQWVRDALDQLDEMAGALRNLLLSDEGDSDLVLSSEGDKAYWDAVEKARAALARHEGRDE